MQVIKTIYEIRYPKLLVFRDVYKEIINPYFIYPNATFSVNNEGSYAESIAITFPDSYNQLYFTNDRITFVFDGAFEEMQKDGSNIEMCFQIINKLKKIKSFLDISKEIIELFAIKEISEEKYQIISNLISLHKFDNLFDFKDIGIIFKGEKDGLRINVHYGLFSGEDDIKAYSLFNLKQEERFKLMEKTGISAKVTLIRDRENVSKKTFSELGNICENYVRKILDNYG